MPAPPAEAAHGYRPRPASNDLKEIVENHLEELLRVWEGRFRKDHGPLHPRLKKLFEAFVRCGDPHFGFLRLRCPGCAHELILPFSCKARGLCPSCSQKRAILWAERMVEEVLPRVPYVQLVFTIPKMLRAYFLWDRSLYGHLSRLAYDSTREFLQAHFPSIEKAVPAMVISPQSFGSLLNHHAHLHSVCSLGVFDREGNFHPAEILDFAPLEELFRQRTLQMMLKREKITAERAELLRGWVHSGFAVNSERRVDSADQKGLESILQYMERAPVSIERLTYRPDSKVLYRGNFHPGLGADHRLVSGVEFLALLVPHILLRFECVIRSYGAVSTTIRRKLGWIGRDPAKKEAPSLPVIDGEESAFVRVRRRSWARLIQKVWLDDPTLCKRCGKEMKVIAAISSPGQDGVIEKILRARGQWDPPWRRGRRARGPPPGAEPLTGLTLHLQLLDPGDPWADETWIDRPHGDD